MKKPLVVQIFSGVAWFALLAFSSAFATDLDETVVQKPTVRSEASRGFNASLEIISVHSIMDSMSAGQSILDRNIQANTATDIQDGAERRALAVPETCCAAR